MDLSGEINHIEVSIVWLKGKSTVETMVLTLQCKGFNHKTSLQQIQGYFDIKGLEWHVINSVHVVSTLAWCCSLPHTDHTGMV